MIESILIKNFQAHKEVTVDFGRITTIVGDSDRGKSAIIRALIWNITNKPNGTYFIRDGANYVETIVKVDDHTVARCRAKSENTYTLDGTEFKAIKTDVPDEIKKVYNVSANCIQQQHDSIFWFSSSPGEVAKQLNQIVNLDIIDYTLGEIASKQRSVKGEIEVLESMKTEQEDGLKHMDEIESLFSIVARIDGFESNLKLVSENESRLNNLILNCERNTAQIKQGEHVLLLDGDLIAFCEEYSKNLNCYKKLSSLIQSLEAIGNIDERCFSISSNVFDKIYSLQTELTEKRKAWRRLNSIAEELQDAESQIEKMKQKAKEFEEEFHNILQDQICPLCGRKD